MAVFKLDEIHAILKASFTHTQIQDILNRIKTAQRDQHGTDRLGLTADQIRNLVNRVAAAVNSLDEDIQREGEVARVLISDLVAFRRKVINPATGKVIGDIDVEIFEVMIEVTNESRNKLSQVLKEKNEKGLPPRKGIDYSDEEYTTPEEQAVHEIEVREWLEEMEPVKETFPERARAE